MKRTTVMFDEQTYERLRQLARRRRTTSSLLIREAVEQYVVEQETSTVADVSPLEGLIGMFDGPAADIGARAEETFAKYMSEKHPPRRDDDPDC